MPDYEFTKDGEQLKQVKNDSEECWFTLNKAQKALLEAQKYKESKQNELDFAVEELATAEMRLNKAIEFNIP